MSNPKNRWTWVDGVLTYEGVGKWRMSSFWPHLGFKRYEVYESSLRSRKLAFVAVVDSSKKPHALTKGLMHQWKHLDGRYRGPLSGFGQARRRAFRLRDRLNFIDSLKSIDPRWLTSNVVSMVEGEGNVDFNILADALMDAGCDDEALLMLVKGDWNVTNPNWGVIMTQEVTTSAL